MNNVDHCYNAWGTSYLPQFSHDSFRVKMVCDSKRGRSIKSGEIALSPANKIIQGTGHGIQTVQKTIQNTYGIMLEVNLGTTFYLEMDM